MSFLSRFLFDFAGNIITLVNELFFAKIRAILDRRNKIEIWRYAIRGNAEYIKNMIPKFMARYKDIQFSCDPESMMHITDHNFGTDEVGFKVIRIKDEYICQFHSTRDSYTSLRDVILQEGCLYPEL